MKITNDRFITM